MLNNRLEKLCKKAVISKVARRNGIRGDLRNSSTLSQPWQCMEVNACLRFGRFTPEDKTTEIVKQGTERTAELVWTQRRRKCMSLRKSNPDTSVVKK